MKWFRWHRGASENPVFALIAERASATSERGEGDRLRGSVSLTDVIAVWAVMLEDAAAKEHWGYCTKTPQFISIVLRWFPEKVAQVIKEMEKEGLIKNDGDALKIVKWNEYQYVSDGDPTSAERQKRYYNKHKRTTHALASRPDTDTDTETEVSKEVREESKKKESKIPPSAVLLCSEIVEDYAYESGIIKLRQKDLDRWKQAFPEIGLMAELEALAGWDKLNGKNWFMAVANALAKKNREAIEKKAAIKVGVEAGMRPVAKPFYSA